jgi:hypothetical protein
MTAALQLTSRSFRRPIDMKKVLAPIIAAAALALTASAQEDGVRKILFANPLVRWTGTVHKKGAGDFWVFYSESDDIKVMVPEGTTPRGFLACKRAASRAVLSWLEQEKNPNLTL